MAAGVTYTTGEIVGPLAGFVVLAVLAAWALVATLRGLGPQRPPAAAIR